MGWTKIRLPVNGDPYARLLLEGEAAVRETAATAVVLRLAGIYGPGRTRLIDRVRAGEPCSEAYTNRIHRDDCAGVLRHLMRLNPRAAAVSGSRPRAGHAVLGDGLDRRAAGASRTGPPPAPIPRSRASAAATRASSPAATHSSTPASGTAMEP